jgi:hypothetical protein
VVLWTELYVVRPAAELAEQRLSGRDSAAIVAIAHKISQKRLSFHPNWPKPDRSENTLAVNVTERRQPKNLSGLGSDDFPDGFQLLLGRGDD